MPRADTDKRFSEDSGIVQVLNILAILIFVAALFAGIGIISNAKSTAVDLPTLDLLDPGSSSDEEARGTEWDYSVLAGGVGVLMQGLIASVVLGALARILVFLAASHEQLELIVRYSEPADDSGEVGSS